MDWSKDWSDFDNRPDFSREEREFLLWISDQCKECGSLAPLHSLIYIPKEQSLTEADIEWGQEMARELGLMEKRDSAED